MAKRFGLPDWSALQAELEAGAILRSPGWVNGDPLSANWHAARIDAGLVILMREEGGVVGLAKTFGPEKMRADLQISVGVFDDTGGKYLAAVNPVAEAAPAYCDLAGVRAQAAAVFGFASAATIFTALVLAAVPVLPFLLLLVGFWTGAAAWLFYGDHVRHRTGQDPGWSIRRTQIGKWIPLWVFGDDIQHRK